MCARMLGPEASRFRSRLSAAILCSSIAFLLVPAHSAFALSELTFLPGDDVIAPAAGRQFLPKIAQGDSLSLVVWADNRTAVKDVGTLIGGGLPGPHTGSRMDVYAARMDVDGSLIDETPIVVAQGAWNQGLPEVAWNGESWLVVWTGQTGIYTCCPKEHRYAARVSVDGTVLDEPARLLVAYPDAEAAWPAAVGSDGTNWLVVWAGRSSSTSWVVRAMRIGPDGTILDPGGGVIASGGYPGDFDVTFAGGEYFVVWSSGGMTSGGSILGQRLAPDLTLIGSPVTINQYSPSIGLNCRVATDGTDYFVAWWENRYDYWSQISSARVSHDGVVLDPDGIFLTVFKAGISTPFEPTVGFDGTHYVVAYQGSVSPPSDIFAVRVTTQGEVLDFGTDAIPVSTAPETQADPAVAGLPGGGSLVVWQDNRHTPAIPGGRLGDIFATTLTPGGAVGADGCISLGAPTQTLLRLSANESGYLAVYRSATSLQTRIQAQRLDATGSALDPEPVTVVAGGSEITNPSVAWNGSVYLVVWEDDFADQTYGRRLDAGLGLVDPSHFPIMPGNTPDVAAVGDLFLTVTSWEEPHEIRRIYFARVRGSDGVVLDSTPQPIAGWYFSLYPRVAAVGSRWLAVWQRHPTHDDPSSQTLAKFIDASGVAGSLISVDGDSENPSVTANENGALFVFEARSEPGFLNDIFARRILADGTYLDPIRGIEVAHEVQQQFEPAVAWNGSEYVVAFGDYRNEAVQPRGDLFAAHLSAAGDVLDPSGFAVAADTIPEMFAEAAAREGEFIVGGSVFRPEAGLGAYRIGVRRSLTSTGVSDHGSWGPVPRLSAARPNPFTAGTTIRFVLPERMPVTLRLVDVRGARVRDLVNGVEDQGEHWIIWDGNNDLGQPVASGVYFMTMQAGPFRDTKKLIVLK
jgi:hypothetical protein